MKNQIAVFMKDWGLSIDDYNTDKFDRLRKNKFIPITITVENADLFEILKTSILFATEFV